MEASSGKHHSAQVRANPVRNLTDWEAKRAAVLADPGAFHGEIAAQTNHWFAPAIGDAGTWLSRDGEGC